MIIKQRAIEQIEQFASMTGFVRFSFYFMGILLIGGGVKKIHANYRRLNER